jgi:hypothetical protein
VREVYCLKITLRKYGEMMEGNLREMSAYGIAPASLESKENVRVFCGFKFLFLELTTSNTVQKWNTVLGSSYTVVWCTFFLSLFDSISDLLRSVLQQN